jgi:NodT family efflux transporter outer membrane factor (OMF) lipoprotein
MRGRRRLSLWLALGSASVTAGCAVGPDYQRPAAAVPADYKEIKGWKIAVPRDDLDKGDWWSIFHDPVLDGLERKVEIDNQTLQAAEAGYREAHAVVAEARAQLFPTLTGDPSMTRTNATHWLATIEGVATWEPDLWGRVRRTIESDSSAAQASAAEIVNVRLSAQASLATDYFELRESDAMQDLLDHTIGQYKRSLQIAQNQYNAGTVARSDVITAQTQLLTLQAQAINIGVARAEYEHAIAVLTGRPPADLSLKHGSFSGTIPTVPVGLPSELLERRPDVATAERQMQQQNALIGVATAAYYPTVTLSGTDGTSGYPFVAGLGFKPFWTLGASAAQTLFNGGLTEAQVAAAGATYDQSVATYRQTVLSAFQQVEDPLAALRIQREQAIAEDAAVRAAEQAVQIALNEYQAGTQSYTTVVSAQATALADEESAITIREQRLAATVSLIEALGGGWDATQLPVD